MTILAFDVYLFGAILIVVLLLILYFVIYILNSKTPVPKGCEDLVKGQIKCGNCTNSSCQFYKKEKEEEM